MPSRPRPSSNEDASQRDEQDLEVKNGPDLEENVTWGLDALLELAVENKCLENVTLTRSLRVDVARRAARHTAARAASLCGAPVVDAAATIDEWEVCGSRQGFDDADCALIGAERAVGAPSFLGWEKPSASKLL